MHAWQWLEHLSDRDLEFLAPGRAADLRRDPRLLPVALDAPQVFARLDADPQPLLRVSPLLLFSVFVRQAARELRGARFTIERTGLRGRAAVFDAPALRRFLEQPEVADYLGELLASFVRTQSGSRLRRTSRGWHRQRFSELDLRSLEALQAGASEAERFQIDRRIGEVALFLLGIFPEALRRSGVRAPSPESVERLGAERLERAARHPLAAAAGTAAVLSAVATGFPQARKVLDYIGERFLDRGRADWFGAP